MREEHDSVLTVRLSVVYLRRTGADIIVARTMRTLLILDLVETYLPPFEACVTQGHGESIMCSYNELNGVPMCSNTFLTQTVLREEYGFDGWVNIILHTYKNVYITIYKACETYLITYIYSVVMLYRLLVIAVRLVMCIILINFFQRRLPAVAVILRSGTDMDCGNFFAVNGNAAYANGNVTDADLDVALVRAFTGLVRLGYFDNPNDQPYRQIGGDSVNSQAHQRAALMTAIQSVVLLKNENDALPLPSTVKSIALIGPHSLRQRTPFSETIQRQRHYIITVQQGFTALGFTVNYVEGCTTSGNSTSHFADALAAAKNSDAVIFVGGIDGEVENEAHDRNSIALPGVQLQLIQALEQVKPVIVVVIGGGQVDLSYCKGSKSSPAIVGPSVLIITYHPHLHVSYPLPLLTSIVVLCVAGLSRTEWRSRRRLGFGGRILSGW